MGTEKRTRQIKQTLQEKSLHQCICRHHLSSGNKREKQQKTFLRKKPKLHSLAYTDTHTVVLLVTQTQDIGRKRQSVHLCLHPLPCKQCIILRMHLVGGCVCVCVERKGRRLLSMRVCVNFCWFAWLWDMGSLLRHLMIC